MDAARLQAVEAIFHAVLEAEPQERDRLLRERCEDDEALRREVEALLSAHEKSGAFIETPIASLTGSLFADEEADRLIGQVIGHYEITSRIGSGGMGAVYLARRADRQYEKQVAIKLIKRGMDTETTLRRFRNERQILAGLDHPNIARLLDGDTTPDGLPYFVMEYVEGLPIDDYCDKHSLGVGARLRLFRQVCAAVSYAHRHAVIHRDLKTSNILVGEDGVPKLLDFGIARLLQQDGSSEAVTMVEQRIMTPEYASPEHLRGEPVTTASDVYSLGVVLYRLLTGRLPYRVKSRLPEDMARTVGATEPQRPSAVVEATGARRLRGDLDNIVLMALRKEPERRYPSVEQFSEDIRRHLDSLPVAARRDTIAYRAGKFVKRNTAAAIAAALVALSLFGGIVMTSWQAKRAREQEAIALAEKARAERRFDQVRSLARSVIFDYPDAIGNISGATVVRERLVKDGLAYLDSLANEAGGDPALQRELAAAYERVGDVRGEIYSAASLGDAAGAMDSYTKSLHIREALVAASPADRQARRELAGSYRKIGTQLIDTSESARGMENLRKSLAIYEQLATEQPGDRELWPDQSAAYNALGLALEDTGNPRAARERHEKALKLRKALVGAEPGNPKFQRALVTTHINIGRALVLEGAFSAGIENNRKAIAASELLLAGDPRSTDYRRLLAIAWQNDGDYRAILRDYDGALQSFRKKLPLDQQAVADDPDNSVARSDLGYSYARIGELLAIAGRYREALGNFRLSLTRYEESGRKSSDNLPLRFRVALLHANVGEMQARMGDRSTALAEAARSLDLLDSIPVDPTSSARSSMRGQGFMGIAAVHAALGEWRRARELYVQSQAVWQDMVKRGILTAEDRTKPEEVVAAIARCDARLK